MYHFTTKKIVFYDLEMFCDYRQVTESMQETIRIGAVMLNTETNAMSFFNEYVKPIHQQRITRFCTKLTGIKQKDIVRAKSFKQVFAQFLSWAGGMDDVTFVAWGKSDLKRIVHDFHHHKMSKKQLLAFKSNHVNLQQCANKITATDRSVEYVLNMFQGRFIGKKHNPKYDAFNTMRIYLYSKDRTHYTQLLTLREQFFTEATMQPFYRLANQLDRHETVSPQKVTKAQKVVAQMIKQELLIDLKAYITYFERRTQPHNLKQMIRRLKKIRIRFKKLPPSIFTQQVDMTEEMCALNAFIHQLTQLEREYLQGERVQPIQPLFTGFHCELQHHFAM